MQKSDRSCSDEKWMLPVSDLERESLMMQNKQPESLRKTFTRRSPSPRGVVLEGADGEDGDDLLEESLSYDGA